MKIKRNKFDMLASYLNEPEIVILLGARQVGKSTLMADLMDLAAKAKMNFRSFNLEFPPDLLFFSRTENEVFSDLTAEPQTLIFIDEFHYLKNASKLFKSIFDLKKNIKIIASGSSSIEMHKHLKESLVGRIKIIRIYPLNFLEWFQSEKLLSDFIVYGGMPGLVHIRPIDQKIEYLSQLVQSYILKDIRGLIKEENVKSFNHLLHFLAENQGQIIPTSNLSNEIRLTNKTVEHYLSILEQTYVVYGLCSFSGKLSNELKKSKKYYFYDTGIRNSLERNFSSLDKREDRGVLFESFVFLELHKKLKSNTDLRFWRTKTGDEVDFIWIENKIPIPIEVKSVFTKQDSLKPMLKFLRTYTKAPYGVLLNEKESIDIVIDEYLIKIRRFDEIDDVLNFSKDISTANTL